MTSTPYFTPSSAGVAVTEQGPLQLKGIAKDGSGTAVDISSGYTARLRVQNGEANGVAVTTTATLNADGSYVILVDQSNMATIPFGTKQYTLELSNDSGASFSVIQTGTITHSPGAGTLS